jgi:hypothetical protein
MDTRSSFKVSLGRLLQRLPFWLLKFLEYPFILLFSKKKNNAESIFVLALPRSGSTVFYQTICHGLSVNYLSNIWNLCYQLPLLGGWISSKITKSHHSNFQSQHGFVSGLDGPAEGLRFWSWWLDCGLSDGECETLSKVKCKKRSGYLNRVLTVLGKTNSPFLTAYLGHVLVPDRVKEAFPKCVLIRLKRDPVSNALSILKSMRTNHSKWFSVLPKECEGLEFLDEHERVAAQVYWLNRRLDDAACTNQMLVIHYEKLCISPKSELKRIRDWLLKNGLKVEAKFQIPHRFNYKMACPYTDRDAKKIKKKFDKLEKQHGKLKYLK